MSMPLSPMRLFTCDHCQASLPLDESQAGQKCRCGRCGNILVVLGPSPRKPRRSSQLVAFLCRNCETRLSARATDTGRKAKCPDCGAGTVIPSPPAPRPKQIPAAMHGEQYGLWGIDEAPFPTELAAQQPKFFPVYCRVCDTTMHARPRQIGSGIACPDCGAKTVVREPPTEKPAKSALVPDGEEYQLDRVVAPAPAPALPAPVIGESESHRSDRAAVKRERLRRSKMPRMPLLRGVLPMLLRQPILGWWLGLSATLSCVAGLAVFVATQHPFVAVCALALATMVGGIAFGAAAALCCAILTDSSEGCDQLYNAPSTAPQQWLGEASYVGLALVVSWIPGWAISQATTQPTLSMALGCFFCFPIVLLSSLEQGSPLAVISFRLVGSLFRCSGQWLMFYLVAALMLFGLGWPSWAILQLSGMRAVLAVPIALAAVLFYFRLLGRHAWWLAGLQAMQRENDQRSGGR